MNGIKLLFYIKILPFDIILCVCLLCMYPWWIWFLLKMAYLHHILTSACVLYRGLSCRENSLYITYITIYYNVPKLQYGILCRLPQQDVCYVLHT